MASTMAFKQTSELAVVVHSQHNPSTPEWEQYLAFVAAIRNSEGYDFTDHRVLVISQGGGPSAAQRAALQLVLRNGSPRTALMTKSAAIRAIGVAISWFNKGFRVFGLNDLDAAFAYLSLTPAQRSVMTRMMSELGTQISVTVPERKTG